MIDYELYCRIKKLSDEGLKCGQIATELGLDERTRAKWLVAERFSQRKSAERQ
jgi:orotate phosphoribosyltransferase-like protein